MDMTEMSDEASWFASTTEEEEVLHEATKEDLIKEVMRLRQRLRQHKTTQLIVPRASLPHPRLLRVQGSAEKETQGKKEGRVIKIGEEGFPHSVLNSSPSSSGLYASLPSPFGAAEGRSPSAGSRPPSIGTRSMPSLACGMLSLSQTKSTTINNSQRHAQDTREEDYFRPCPTSSLGASSFSSSACFPSAAPSTLSSPSTSASCSPRTASVQQASSSSSSSSCSSSRSTSSSSTSFAIVASDEVLETKGSSSDRGFSNLLKDLNPSQREAVTQDIKCPLLIIAGPGSGKTYTLCYRIVYLLLQGVSSSQILALSFTRAAGHELKLRSRQLQESCLNYHLCPSYSLRTGTFHSFCLEILQTYRWVLQYKRSLKVVSEKMQEHIIQEALLLWREKCNGKLEPVARRLFFGDDDGQKDITNEGEAEKYKLKNLYQVKRLETIPKHEVEQFLRVVGQFKSAGDPPAQYVTDELRFVLRHYERRLKEENKIDFVDMLRLTLQLFKAHPSVLDAVRKKYKWILVDEAQDMNKLQHDLIWALTEHSGQLTMVGDDDQAIYSFRGGSSEYIRSLQQRFEEKGKTVNKILLEQNYRSTKSITDCANSLIQQNQKRLNKKMWTKNEQGSTVHVIACASPEEEADFVAQCILHIKTEAQLAFADFAILFRARHVEPSFAQKFKQLDIPFLTRTSQSLVNRAVVKDVLAYAVLLNEPKNDKAFKRVLNVPARRLGPATLAYLEHTTTKLIEKARQQARTSITSSSHSISHFSKGNDVSLYEAAIYASGENFPAVKASSTRTLSLKRKQKEQLNDFLEMIQEMQEKMDRCSLVEALEFIIERSNYKEHLWKRRNQVTAKKAKNPSKQGAIISHHRRSEEKEREAELKKDPNTEREGAQVESEDTMEEKYIDELIYHAKLFEEEQQHPSTKANQGEHDKAQMKNGRELVGDFLKWFEESAALNSNEEEGKQSNAVTITTIHQAKGREWPNVFLVSFNEGVMPSRHRPSCFLRSNVAQIDDPTDHLEEERRLAYVAMTRAKQQLFLTHSLCRTVANSTHPRRETSSFRLAAAKPSPFLEAFRTQVQLMNASSYLQQLRTASVQQAINSSLSSPFPSSASTSSSSSSITTEQANSKTSPHIEIGHNTNNNKEHLHRNSSSQTKRIRNQQSSTDYENGLDPSLTSSVSWLSKKVNAQDEEDKRTELAVKFDEQRKKRHRIKKFVNEDADDGCELQASLTSTTTKNGESVKKIDEIAPTASTKGSSDAHNNQNEEVQTRSKRANTLKDRERVKKNEKTKKRKLETNDEMRQTNNSSDTHRATRKLQFSSPQSAKKRPCRSKKNVPQQNHYVFLPKSH